MKNKMDEKQALDIIHNERINNSFTMGLTLDEFVEGFKIRYLKVYDEVLPNDYVSIAKKIVELNNKGKAGVK